MERAYEAYLEYVAWRYANADATLNDELLTQWRLAHSYVLDPEQKAYMTAWCWQFDKHGRKATAEADRTDADSFRVDV
jgi:hypothetical protein